MVGTSVTKNSFYQDYDNEFYKSLKNLPKNIH